MNRGVRVVDLTRVLAGPWATMILGDQGFDVIKIEPPEGDETRRFQPWKAGESVYFACTNRNKRSVVLDLKTAAGRAALLRLVETADVLVENFRPGVMARLGLDDEVLRARRPDLVHVSISAFGPGPFAERAGYDLVLQSAGGIASLTGDPPRKAGPSIADLASALTAVQAVLFALLRRYCTGEGERIHISMLDVQHALLAYYASAWLNVGQEPPEPGNRHPSICPYNLYRCRDGWLAICCANEPLWDRLKQVLMLEDRPWFGSMAARLAHRDDVDAQIEAALEDDDAAVWEARLLEAGVPCSVALTVPQSLAQPAARRIHIGNWIFPAPPLAPRCLRPPPTLGEHTAEVLAEVGLLPTDLLVTA